MKMKRIILDTNIYGLIVIDKDRLKIINNILNDSEIKICGSGVIRKELRNTPKGLVDGINLRNDLLRLFDQLTRYSYEITPEMRKMAENYLIIYGKLGGRASKQDVMNDFLIVACASSHDMDIVNSLLKKKTPNFINYKNFREMIM